MRVTSRSMVDSVVRYLQQNAQALDDIQKQVISGKRITRPSDDPAAAWRALRLRRDQADNNQLLRNIDEARNWLTANDRALNAASDALARLRELAVQGADDSYVQTDRRAIAREVAQLKEHLLGIFNGTIHVDQKVFGGLKTTTTPLTVDANGNIVYTGDTGVTIPAASGDLDPANGIQSLTLTDATSAIPGSYRVAISAPILPDNTTVQVTATRYDTAGNPVAGASQTLTVTIPQVGELNAVDFGQLGLTLTVNSAVGTLSFGENAASEFAVGSASIAREIAPGTNLPVNLLASGFLTMFQDINRMEKALNANDQPNIAKGIANLDTAINRVLTVHAEIGTRMNRLDVAHQRRIDIDAEVARVQVATEDVDMVAALTRLTTQQAIYRATLETGARTIPMSILDFLR
jgi:flagellar hook-associated protein 3 FlgL